MRKPWTDVPGSAVVKRPDRAYRRDAVCRNLQPGLAEDVAGAGGTGWAEGPSPHKVGPLPRRSGTRWTGGAVGPGPSRAWSGCAGAPRRAPLPSGTAGGDAAALSQPVSHPRAGATARLTAQPQPPHGTVPADPGSWGVWGEAPASRGGERAGQAGHPQRRLCLQPSWEPGLHWGPEPPPKDPSWSPNPQPPHTKPSPSCLLPNHHLLP